MSSIYDWSLVAASNSNADSAINWNEGQAPSTVNGSARGMMQRGKELLVDIGGSLSAGGTANGLTVTAASPFTAYADGLIISFRATASNTGAATLSVNGIGAKAIRKMDSTGDVALVAGEIQNTGLYVAQYSAALNGAAGAWLLINPTFSGVVGPASSTDHALARFDGVTGKLIQNSTVTLSDAGVFAGGAWNGTAGATTPATGAFTTLSASGAFTGAAISGTTGTFSGAVSGTTGAFSGAITGASLSVTGNVDSGGSFRGNSGETILENLVENQATIVASFGSTGIRLRPNGSGSGVGQVVLDESGDVVINGTLTVTG